MAEIRLEPGSAKWNEFRKKCTTPVPSEFSSLFFLAAKVLGLEKKIPLTVEEHYAMCLFAERATGIPEIDNARVQLIQVPRGIGKSAVITIGRTIQRYCQDVNWCAGIANETANMANRFLSGVKGTFEQNEFFRALWPELIPNFRDTRWRDDEIVINRTSVNPNPSGVAVGLDGTRTGLHMNEWIVDDPISKSHAEAARKGNFAPIETANQWIVQLPPLLNRPTRDPLTFIGTPWFINDTYDFIERFFGFVPGDVTNLSTHPKDFECLWTLKLPGGVVQHHTLYRRGDIAVFRRDALEQGRSFFPSFWSTEELETMQVSPEGAEFFAANFRLNPSAGAAAEFKADWLKTFDWEGADTIRFRDQQGRTSYASVKDLAIFISVDPAFSKRNTACRSAVPVVGTDGTHVFLLEDYAKRGIGIDDIANVVVGFCMKYNVRKVFVETISAQIAVADAIRRIAKERGVWVNIHEIPSHGRAQKNFRVYSLEPYVKRGLFYHHRSHQAFLEEYLAFPRSSLRDVLDALAFQTEEWGHVTLNPNASPVNAGEFDRLNLQRIRDAFSRKKRR